jgi:hypothetical protein
MLQKVIVDMIEEVAGDTTTVGEELNVSEEEMQY